jgi:small subunit ribosomal protein S18
MAKTHQNPEKPKEFSYRHYEALAAFLSDRAKVLPGKRTGLTSREQRELTTAIKHARHLGLLPFKAQV